MSKDTRLRPIGEILLDKGLITREQLDDALAQQKDAPEEKLGEILIRLGYVSQKDVIQAFAEQVLMMYGEEDQEQMEFTNLVSPPEDEK